LIDLFILFHLQRVSIGEGLGLEAKVLGNRLNLEKMSKTSPVSKTHALIQASFVLEMGKIMLLV